MKKFSRFLMLALCCGLLLSSCGDSDTTADTSGGETSTEPVVVKYWGGSPAGMDGIQENLIADQIEKDIGVRLSCYANRDDAALTAMFASGDVPDLIDFSGLAGESGVTATNRLIENNRLMELDDLIAQYAPDIQKMENYLQFHRDIYGNGTGKLYVLQRYIDKANEKCTSMGGFTVPFHYYAELGYPEIRSMDDILNVANQMVQNHPTNENGERCYGVSIFFEWGLMLHEWGDLIKSMEGESVVSGRAGQFLELNLETMETSDFISNLDSTMWKGTELFYRANQMGIMDPDIYTNKVDTVTAKADRIYFAKFNFASAFNQAHAEEGLGFENLPLNSKQFVLATDSPMGAAHRMNVIPAEAEEPVGAIKYLNYTMSEDGVRTLNRGIEGEHYIEQNGKFIIPKTITDAIKEDPNYYQNLGIGQYYVNLGGSMRDSRGQLLNLGEPSDMEDPPELTNFEKIYCEHYGIDRVNEQQSHLEGYTIDGTALALIAPMPDDLAEKAVDINAYIMVEVPNLIMSESDEEFKEGQARIIEECKKKGLDEVVEFQRQAFADAVKAAEKYK